MHILRLKNLKNTNRSSMTIYLIIGLNALLILLADIFLPVATVFVGVLFGTFIYYRTYSVPSRKVLWMELRLYVVALVGISLGSWTFWIACGYIQKPICLPNNFRAQILGNYAFPLVFLTLTWLFYRLPVIIKGRK